MAHLYKQTESGMWKFRDKITPEELVKVAEQLRDEEPRKYIDLHIRRCSKDQIGIGFKYVRDDDETSKDFFERISDPLRRQFGNDFVGWDIGHMTWIIGQDLVCVPHWQA